MRTLLVVGAVLVGCCAQDPKADAQYLQSKGGGGGQFQYRGSDNLFRFFNNTQGTINIAPSADHRVGICMVEVRTATLARDQTNVPRGNGSRPDLSRIETCCQGYIRNIHNARLCDPICTNGCVNGLCTAPETCTCYPEHVRNLAGFCLPTCPIGCQNGHCNGGQCMCKEGFTLDRGGQFCVPRCRDNCGGGGNCTAPNICSCNSGYHSTPEGSCKSGIAPPTPNSCSDCINGDCINGKCQCRPGYLIYNGECFPLCNPPCTPDAWCAAPNTCSSSRPPPNYRPHQFQNNTNPGQNINRPQNTTNLVNYPYPPNSQNLNGQNPNNQHPSPYPQFPYGQPSQYPQGQLGQTYPNQPNSTYPNQGHPLPGQQHLYPNLPQNQYPANPNQPNNSNRNDGQVYYQNSLNRLENTTFNLQQGTQGYTHGQSQFTSQGQSTEGQYSSRGQTAGHVFYQNAYNPLENTTFNLQQGTQGRTQGQGQYTSQGQRNEGQYLSQGQYGEGVIALVNYPNGFNKTSNSQQSVYGISQVPGQGAPQGQHRGDIDSTQGQQNQHQNTGQVFSQNSYNSFGNASSNVQQGTQGHAQGQGTYSSQWQHNSESNRSQEQYGQGQFVSGQGQYVAPGQTYVYGQAFEPQSQQQSLNWPEQGPQCAQPCINGNCVGSNRCECFSGYKHDQNDLTGARCLPHCPGGCYNGYCSAPNTCTCGDGYYRDFGVKGRFVCVLRERRST